MYQSKYRGDEIEQKLDQLDVTQPLSEVISDFDKDLADQSRKLTELESEIGKSQHDITIKKGVELSFDDKYSVSIKAGESAKGILQDTNGCLQNAASIYMKGWDKNGEQAAFVQSIAPNKEFTFVGSKDIHSISFYNGASYSLTDGVVTLAISLENSLYGKVLENTNAVAELEKQDELLQSANEALSNDVASRLLQSDFEKIFTLGGVNLFNKAEAVQGYIDFDSNGMLRSETWAFTSPYIQVQAGKKYSFLAPISIYGESKAKQIATYDAKKENYSFVKGDLSNGIATFTAERNGFVRFSIESSKISVAMFVEGEEYPTTYEPFTSADFKSDFTSSRLNNPIYGKSILWLGDSIGEGLTANDGKYGWSGRIAERNNGTYHSLARSGNTITKNVASGVGSILTKLEEFISGGYKGDYLIIEGGTNDADRIGSILNGAKPEKFGEWSMTDYSGNYDENTFCGAVDAMFYKALNAYKGVKIGYMVAQKMDSAELNVSWNILAKRRAYFDVIIEMCKKWGIPYLDLWNVSRLNPYIKNQFDNTKTTQGNTDAHSYYVDGQHLTADGYDALVPIIEQWLMTI